MLGLRVQSLGFIGSLGSNHRYGWLGFFQAYFKGVIEGFYQGSMGSLGFMVRGVRGAYGSRIRGVSASSASAFHLFKA